ncbi:hypothetical protein M407DRAFT_28898 [Tulasnella calospora MUT 4182]|uniref:Uncharacterized protein n=1 Tax=Tulasnella calospora MUT 4182 TaxID=1051891 RepID=A0A0C3Q9V9_9AGAM|nr:hypothetical protein M407DRAFT_28898 [Tulasnella calospora MUT 4182]
MTEGIDQETYKRLAAERITNTSIGVFDQLTIVTQRAINGDDAPDYYFIADLNPPTVTLSLGPNKQTVVFNINIKSGKIGWYKGVGPKAKPLSEDLGPSRLALRVNMALDQLDQSKISDHIKTAVGKVDDYSVQQLLFDFTTADLISSTNGDGSDFNISQEGKSQLYGLVNQYLELLQAKGADGNPAEHNIINYTVTAKNPQAFTKAPTCAPTNLNFQNLPFVIKESDRTSPDAVLGGKNSMLVYLQMTENRKMPNTLLEPAANWVMPPFDETSELYDGVVCLSKASFLDGFLLPQLANFNRESTWVVDEAWWKAVDLGFNNEYKVSGHVGLTAQDLQDPFFKDYQWKLTSFENGVRKYEYHKTHRKDDNHGLWRVWQEGRTSNYLTIPEGLDSSSKYVMKLSRNTMIETYPHLDGIGEIGKTRSLVTCIWNASLILDGVDNGELHITAEIPKEPIIRTDEMESFLYPNIMDKIMDRIRNGFKYSEFANLQASLEKLFNGSWAFVFAQGRDFFIDKACFNREGDLLCQLKYRSAGSGNPPQPVGSGNSPQPIVAQRIKSPPLPIAAEKSRNHDLLPTRLSSAREGAEGGIQDT